MSSSSQSTPSFDQLFSESRTLFREHFNLGRLFLSLRSSAWSSLHLDAQGKVDFYRPTLDNEWRLALASLSSGAVATVDSLGPLRLELGSRILSSRPPSKTRFKHDESSVISGSARLYTCGSWYCLDSRYNSTVNRLALSAVVAHRNVYSIGDRLLFGTSVEGFSDQSEGRGIRQTQLTVKWISPVSDAKNSYFTSYMASIKDTSNFFYFPPSSVFRFTVGVYCTKLPLPSTALKFRRSISRKSWTEPVVSQLQRCSNSSGLELRLDEEKGMILSAGSSSLMTANNGDVSQVKVKVNSRGELAVAIARFYADLTSFAPTTVFSISGMVNFLKLNASLGFGLEFAE